MARSPSRLCSRDGKICCNGDALSMTFLLAFVPCFLLFVFRFSFHFFIFIFLHPGVFTLFVSLPLCSSHLLLSASTYFIVRVISACVICTWYPILYRNSFVLIRLFFFVALISRVAFFCGALVPGTLALDLPTLIP